MEAISEHSPPSAPTTNNGSSNNAADCEGNSASRAPGTSAEEAPQVSYKGDSNPQTFVNGLS